MLTLSQTSDFLLFKTERVCRYNFIYDENDSKFSRRVEKHCWRRRNFSLQAISPFPTVFSKDLCSRHVKARARLGKG